MEHSKEIEAIIQNRKRFVEIMESAPEKVHTRGAFKFNGQYCAIGLFLSESGEYVPQGTVPGVTKFEKMLGLPEGAGGKVMEWNDDRKFHFKTIARWFIKMAWPIKVRS